MTNSKFEHQRASGRPEQTQPPSLARGTDDQARDHLVGQLCEALPRLLAHDPIALAYLHGSTATGRTTPFSDVDIALIADEDLDAAARLHLMLRLQVELADVCGIHSADVRVINDAPLVLRGRVVTLGILLYARDEQARIDFEIATRMRYFDYLPVHRALRDAYLTELKERGLYGGP